MTRMNLVWAITTRQFGAVALFNNVDGSENTAVGNEAGQNVITASYTYVGGFVGTLADRRKQNHPHRRRLERERGRVLTVLHRWYLQ